ncbi:MAG: hypothetical protein IPK16_05900 [Anaerolineales bacterium]|nr:hypothetical protein [Anaerolineales bacterium]
MAIESLAESTARRAGLAAEIQVDENTLSLPPAIEQGVYRIAQEAFANVARHASATTLHVTLRRTDGLQLTIRDNGRGFCRSPPVSMGITGSLACASGRR